MIITPGSSAVAGPAATTGSAAAVKDDEGTRQREKLKKATQQFEAVFIGVMLKESRKTMAGTDALFGSSQENKMYTEMSDTKMAEQMSESGSFGLAKTLYRSLERLIPGNAPEAESKNLSGDAKSVEARETNVQTR